MADLEHVAEPEVVRRDRVTGELLRDGANGLRRAEPGNQIALKHGANSTFAIAPRAAELAGELRQVVPTYSPADEVSVRLLAITLARIERAVAALERVDGAAGENPLGPYLGDSAEVMRWLRTDLRLWVASAGRLAESLGLTPTSRAKLGLDVARTGDALADYLAEHYPAEPES